MELSSVQNKRTNKLIPKGQQWMEMTQGLSTYHLIRMGGFFFNVFFALKIIRGVLRPGNSTTVGTVVISLKRANSSRVPICQHSKISLTQDNAKKTQPRRILFSFWPRSEKQYVPRWVYKRTECYWILRTTQLPPHTSGTSSKNSVNHYRWVLKYFSYISPFFTKLKDDLASRKYTPKIKIISGILGIIIFLQGYVHIFHLLQ